MPHSYRQVRDQRKGTGSMTIEPADPKKGTVIDPSKHSSESLDLPDKTGMHTMGGIGEIPSVEPKEPMKLMPTPVHPGDFSRSEKYSPITKT